MRYFLEFSYNGSGFHGWQSQPNAVSVQQRIEEALQTVLRAPTPVTGAGRTDAGVHARCMFAHFDTVLPLPDKGRLLLALNRLAGPGIAFSRIIDVHKNAHARFDASLRTYKYFVTWQKNPFLNTISWHSPSALDVDAMNMAAAFLLETSDFTSFAKLHSDAKTNICKVSEARWTPLSEENYPGLFNPSVGPGIVFTISADRFLRNMVRAVVGTLVDVGRGKLSLAQFKDIVARKDRCAAGTSMPPQALFLWDVKYPYISS